MKLKGKEVQVDKEVLVKAVGVMLLGWLALPILYYILLREKKRNAVAEKEVKTEDEDMGKA